MSTKYVQVKREKISKCNICRMEKPLTWDHIPPQGGIKIREVEQQAILNLFSEGNKNRKYSISQNGVKYRTICKTCNEFLGQKFDQILNRFAIGVGNILKSFLHIPDIIDFETQPAAIIRALLGHLLAAKSNIDDVVIDQTIRSFLFDDSINIPEEIKIFYWIYPYNFQVIIRDVAMPAKRGNFKKFGIFNIIKYFPIAYLITDLEEYEGLDELTLYRKFKLDQTARIPINLKNFKDADWPEKVDDENVLMGGLATESSLYATPRLPTTKS